ncbi:hypothetical protein [Ralstonia syzygii]|uniref:hypothetical protein n=1 Tax=Ralstonia syzygii TaxID=28097 RepID=UPI001BA5554D|nr:hypothetical protein [Ralstonia syzygii]
MKHTSSADAHQLQRQITDDAQVDLRGVNANGSTQASRAATYAKNARTPGPADSYLAGHHDYVVAQTYAFGVLIVVLSLITAAAMLAAKRPEHMERAACWIVGILIDWRTWALLTAGLVVVAVVYILLQPRR